ncbi:MAG TPA: MarR family transcriptional regulator [Candidatus Faecicola pullistercoris]|nr:MarR family transcriptional regulator [Candidatus Faecicola pullistercoris]
MEKKRIGFELKKITTRMKRILDLQCADSREPITGVQGWIVAYVCNNPDRDVFQRDIEEMFRIRRSTATGILNGMQAAGLIFRRAVDYDARLKKIVPTEKAVILHGKAKKALDEFESNLKKNIPEDKLAVFFEVLARIGRNLDELE